MWNIVKDFWENLTKFQKIQLICSFIPYYSTILILFITYITLALKKKRGYLKLCLAIIPICLSVVLSSYPMIELLMISFFGAIINIIWIHLQNQCTNNKI